MMPHHGNSPPVPSSSVRYTGQKLPFVLEWQDSDLITKLLEKFFGTIVLSLPPNSDSKNIHIL